VVVAVDAVVGGVVVVVVGVVVVGVVVVGVVVVGVVVVGVVVVVVVTVDEPEVVDGTLPDELMDPLDDCEVGSGRGA